MCLAMVAWNTTRIWQIREPKKVSDAEGIGKRNCVETALLTEGEQYAKTYAVYQVRYLRRDGWFSTADPHEGQEGKMRPMRQKPIRIGI